MAIPRTQQAIAAWIFGALTLIFLMAVFFVSGQEVSQLQHRIAGLIGAAMAAFFGFFFTGSMKIVTEGQLPKWGKVSIQAGSGFALFVFVLIWWGSNAAPVKVTAEPQRKTTVEVDASDGGQAATNVISGDIDVGPGGSLRITAKTGLSGEDVKSIIETVLQHAKEERSELFEKMQSTVEERDRLKTDLASAIERASQSESERARATLAELRDSGDTTRLLAFLRWEDLRPVQREREEQLKIKREIASVAFLTGEIDAAKEALDAILAIDADDIDAVNRLGLIQELRGDLAEAERSYKRVLTLAGEDKAGRAIAYGNLGIVFFRRGELDEAEAMYRKSLEIDEQMGNKEGMAAVYGNLGIVFSVRGDLAEAETMYLKALEIDEQMGNKEGMAAAYGNLGIVFFRRGEMDEAESMYLKALDLNEELGNKEHMAVQYGNLGIVLMIRGELDEADAMHGRALDLHEQLGSKEGMAQVYGNLGNVFRTRGEFDEAEAMYRKGLEIDEQLGRKEGMAAKYGNLGALHEERGEFDRAREAWTQSLDLYKQMGVPDKIALNQSLLDRLPETGADAPPG